jgi:predicted ATPase
MLVGRVEECTSVDRLLEEARAGRGGALAICGEPGIGKTSLLDYAAGRADGMRVVHARGVQSETTVPFAALVDLLTPLGEAIGALPERQAEALASALAIGPPRPADRLAVLVGSFNLLCAAAAARPLLVLVDDAHWLDAASAEAIGFAARRIGADPVALVIASRTPGLSGIPSL